MGITGGAKVTVSVLSLLLLMGAAVEGDQITQRVVDAFCQLAPHKDICVGTIGAVSKNDSSTPKDYLMAMLSGAAKEIEMGMKKTEKTNVKKDDKLYVMAKDDCSRMLEYAVEELNAAISTVDDSNDKSLGDRIEDLLNWLTAVYSYQSYCIDEFNDSDYKPEVRKGLETSLELTHNAIDIVAKISNFVDGFNVQGFFNDVKKAMGFDFFKGKSSRRLLDNNNDNVMGADGYPTWMGHKDRKLMAAGGAGPAPDAVVAKDGSGKFKTITEALKAYAPAAGAKDAKYVIHVKAGTYEENVLIDRPQVNVFIYGDGIGKTIITANKNFKLMNIQTPNTGTIIAIGDGFKAKGLTIRNHAGPEGHQACALVVQSDAAAIWDCSLEAYQDTLFYQVHRQFYRDCTIYGTTDFVFGKGQAVLQNCKLIVRKGLDGQYNVVTADGKELEHSLGGVVLQNCQISADPALPKAVLSYLARPWAAYSKLVIMQSDIGQFINPEGYRIWDGANNHQTCEYLEYGNKGAGSNTSKRNYKSFPKSKAIDAKAAEAYTVKNFIQGDTWIPATGAPFNGGM